MLTWAKIIILLIGIFMCVATVTICDVNIIRAIRENTKAIKRR